MATVQQQQSTSVEVAPMRDPDDDGTTTAPAPAPAQPKQPAASVAPASVARTADDIARTEAEIEGKVQAVLETHDPWRIVAPIHQMNKVPEAEMAKFCTKDHHICDLDSDRMCLGCAFYKNIIKTHSVFGAKSMSDMCDVVGMIMQTIAAPLIRDGKWLAPMDEFTGEWFVYFPVFMLQQPQRSLIPGPYATIKRNRVRVFEARTLLDRLGLGEYKTYICRKLAPCCTTSKSGSIYWLNDLLDKLAPISAPLGGLVDLGIPIKQSGPGSDAGFDVGTTPLEKLALNILALSTELRG
jgi:hypothetical protein